MPWQSPYRGEESPLDRLSPRAKEWVSRGVMLGVGLLLAYIAVRGMIAISAPDFVYATTVPVHNGTGRGRGDGRPLLWLLLILLAFVGSSLAVAALVPAATMQGLFERFNRPPETGDRTPDADNWYGRPWWLGGRWRRW